MKRQGFKYRRTRFAPRFVQTVVWAILVFALIPGCGQSDEISQVQVEDLRLTKLPSGAKILTGSVHNGSTAEIAGVLIQVSLFDDHNNLLSSVTIGVKEIAPGGDQEFREPLDTDLDVQRARVKKLVSL